MSPEVRRAALLAAAKTTFIVSLGCSSNLQPSSPAAPPPASTASSATPDAPVAAPVLPCAQHLDGLATANPEQLPASDPLHDRLGVYGAFTDIAARNSERTRECCTEELTRDHGGAAHRWACCSALSDADGNTPSIQGSACTPWGPPCPPELLA